MNSNWFDQDASKAHQNELYHTAAQARLAREAGESSRIVSVYEAAMASLGRRMILWGTNLQKRAGQPSMAQPQMKTV